MTDTTTKIIEGVNVELTLHYTIENDSFDHEFGTEKYDDYLALEDVTFDRQKYAEIANKVDTWIDDYWYELDLHEIEENDDFPDPDEQYQEMREREMRDLDRNEP